MQRLNHWPGGRPSISVRYSRKVSTKTRSSPYQRTAWPKTTPRGGRVRAIRRSSGTIRRFFTPSYSTTGWRNPSRSGKRTPHGMEVRLPEICPSMKLPIRPTPMMYAPAMPSTSATRRNGRPWRRQKSQTATEPPARIPWVDIPPSQRAGMRHGWAP
jgi:hypothetical protein